MTTLIGVYGAKGCVGFCDARCYNALPPSQLKEPRRTACVCICGGANHAGGLDRAVKNHDRGVGLSQEDLVKFCEVRGLDPAELVVLDRMRIQTSHLASKMSRALLAPQEPLPLFECSAIE